MADFLPPLIGGILIGLASSLMLAGIGRITGISGILGSVLETPKREHDWRYSFLGGLLVGGLVLKLVFPSLFNYEFVANWPLILAAGLLVGFGTRLGSGCTSGHGVCGISRLSKRSLAATLIFIVSGVLTVWLKGVL